MQKKIAVLLAYLTLLSPVSAADPVAADPVAADPEIDSCKALAELYGVLPQNCTSIKSDTSQTDLGASGQSQSSINDVEGTAEDSTLDSRSAMNIDHVFFRSGGKALDADALKQLEALVQLLESPPLSHTCVGLVGHADNVGGQEINIQLSGARADVVADFLRQRLTLPDRIVAVLAAGSSSPIPGIGAAEPAQRRVTLLLRDCAVGDISVSQLN